jgi:peptidoglycan/xylan/chitin deacetylase (PgdA/CDA1 family)
MWKRMKSAAVIIAAGLCLPVLCPAGETASLKGSLALSFDDGYRSWLEILAPELDKAGGVATAYVANERVQRGQIGWDEIALLQNRYGWEIGTHTYNHLNAPDFVRRRGLEAWLEEELRASVEEMRSRGLAVSTLAFPFNLYTPELADAARREVGPFRRVDAYPLAASPQGHAYPGSSIDLAQYIPTELLVRWLDEAHRSGAVVFLYGHEILPDERYLRGIVEEVEADALTTREGLPFLPSGEPLCLVPDVGRRVPRRPLIQVESIDGRRIRISGADLRQFAAPGAAFLVGPPYSRPLSDFRAIIGHAAGKVHFQTTRQAMGL